MANIRTLARDASGRSDGEMMIRDCIARGDKQFDAGVVWYLLEELTELRAKTQEVRMLEYRAAGLRSEIAELTRLEAVLNRSILKGGKRK